MQALNWREIDFGSVVLAGLIGGYLMALAGLWAGRVPGFVSIDIADFGRRYIVSDRPSAWLIGMVSHLINSIIFVLVWATLIQPNLSWPQPLSGILWGVILAMTLSGAMVGPMTGMGFMWWRAGTLRFAATNLLLHAAWGVVIGLIYVRRAVLP